MANIDNLYTCRLLKGKISWAHKVTNEEVLQKNEENRSISNTVQ